MPELPEVQNTVDGLSDRICNARIVEVWTDYHSNFYLGKKNIKDPAYFSYFKKQVLNRVITHIERRGKQIYIHLDSPDIIVVHMKMTGHFLVGHWQWNTQENKWEPEEGFWNSTWKLTKEEVRSTMPFSDPYNDFIHLMFTLEDGRQVAFSDMRKFATIFLSNQEELPLLQHTLGIDPLDTTTTVELFISQLNTKPNKKIKTALLDQSLVSGFGNIYSDEVLFAAQVHPERLVHTITKQEWSRLYIEAQNILQKAIAHGGDSMGDYRRVDGTGGSFQGMHQVYQKEGSACARCGCVIVKKQIDQRVGRFCPCCQKLN